MISDTDSYLAKLQEIQNSNLSTIFTQTPVEPNFVIDANTRQITIPSGFKNIGVINDHNAETIYFEIDRYFDNEDLNNHICVVQYINENSESDIYPVVQKDLSTEGKLIFGWTISNHVTKYQGEVKFAVRFYTIVDNAFTFNLNTAIATFDVLNGLDVTSNVSDITPDVLTTWMSQVNATMTTINNDMIAANTSATNAKTSETNAANSAQSASNYATAALASQNSASQSLTDITVMLGGAKIDVTKTQAWYDDSNNVKDANTFYFIGE